MHLIRILQITRLKCLKCHEIFVTQKDLNAHYTLQHGISLNHNRLRFSCYKNFQDWLENVKSKDVVNFKVAHRRTTATNSIIWHLICHRSRGYSDLPNTDERKRCLKVNGYKGLEGSCPAEIKVTQFQDETCVVDYQPTHVGHTVGDPEEWKHVYLSDPEKLQIAAKIHSGVPKTLIWKQQLLGNSQKKFIFLLLGYNIKSNCIA